jgi:CheY-like chemotaxis protein
VLLADDGPMILETIRACLEAAGYRVLTARDGVEAVEVLTAHQTDIGVAVLDVDMPRMGGLEALERMQEIRPDLPALISTGHSAVALGRAWPPSGRVGIVEKPFDLTELLRRVQEVLGGALEPE